MGQLDEEDVLARGLINPWVCSVSKPGGSSCGLTVGTRVGRTSVSCTTAIK